MIAELINGKKIAEEIKSNIKKQILDLKSKYNIVPNIVTIKIGHDPSSELYLKLRDKACNDVGVQSSHIDLNEKVSEKEVINKINILNENNKVHGILVQYPVPNHISQYNLMSSIDPIKDVEGFNPVNMGNILIGNEEIVPCTPLAVLKIIEHEKINLKGKEIVIINHSNVVGKPLATLLLNRNATVTICHVFTKDVKSHSKNADILITATGIPGLVNKDFVKNNSFVIDVGISKTNKGISGDVDIESVKNITKKITPVPGGVGPVTIACSLQNMIKVFLNTLEYK